MRGDYEGLLGGGVRYGSVIGPSCCLPAAVRNCVYDSFGFPRLFFFFQSLLACDLFRSWRYDHIDRGDVPTSGPIPVRCPNPASISLQAARCKLPFALRQGLSQEDVECTKEITKESPPQILLLFRGHQKSWRG